MEDVGFSGDGGGVGVGEEGVGFGGDGGGVGFRVGASVSVSAVEASACVD